MGLYCWRQQPDISSIFSEETELTFRSWQCQARLLAGIVKLAEG